MLYLAIMHIISCLLHNYLSDLIYFINPRGAIFNFSNIAKKELDKIR